MPKIFLSEAPDPSRGWPGPGERRRPALRIGIVFVMAIMPRERIQRRRSSRAASGEAPAPAENAGIPEALARKLTPPPRPYEVRCHHCDTSFAPGTKVCVHCGRRVGRAVPIVEFSPGPPIEGDDEEIRPSPARSAIWIVTAVLMLIGSAMRACQ